jgi:hypothetical protein
MIWHVAWCPARSLVRKYFSSHIPSGSIKVGTDPERSDDGQVIEEVRYLSREELAGADGLYPTNKR